MNALTCEVLRISCPIAPVKLLWVDISVRENRHAEMTVKGIFENPDFSILKNNYQGQRVRLYESTNSSVVFDGIIDQIELKCENEYAEVCIKAKSGSVLLDQELKSRSFQDVRMTYRQLIDKVLQDTPHAEAELREEWNRAIGYPIIQYRETDWEFLKRIASHFNISLIPDIRTGQPKLWIGLKDGVVVESFDSPEYTVGVNSRYRKLGGHNLGFKRSDFLYYRIKSLENHSVGDKIEIKGQTLSICRKKAALKDGALEFDYTLSKDGFISQYTEYNDLLSGMSILGSVLETAQETVKIHLDIDETQDKDTAYPYKWTPVSGDLMYLMPKVGTTVSLYFSNADEACATAVNCVRTNGGESASCPQMTDYNERALRTEHGKQLLLYPEQIALIGAGEDSPPVVILDDAEGVSFSSPAYFSLLAKNKIEIIGKNVYLGTPKSEDNTLAFAKVPLQVSQTGDGGAEVIVGDAKSIIFSQDQHLMVTGSRTILAGQVFNPCPLIEDAPKEGEFDGWKLFGNIIGGLAIVAVGTIAVAGLVVAGVLTGGAALVAGVAIAGTMAVGALAVSDFNSGNVSDFGSYAGAAILSMALAVVGGPVLGKVLGKIGGSIPMVLKVGLTGFLTAGTISAGYQLVTTGDIRPRSTLSTASKAGIMAMAAYGLTNAISKNIAFGQRQFGDGTMRGLYNPNNGNGLYCYRNPVTGGIGYAYVNSNGIYSIYVGNPPANIVPVNPGTPVNALVPVTPGVPATVNSNLPVPVGPGAIIPYIPTPVVPPPIVPVTVPTLPAPIPRPVLGPPAAPTQLPSPPNGGGLTPTQDWTRVPGIKDFNEWFDNIPQSELDKLWVTKARGAIEDRIRNPGGLHEWLPVSRAPVFKRWGVSMDLIKSARSPTSLQFRNPPGGGHGVDNSGKFHKDILEAVDTSSNFYEFLQKLNVIADYWLPNGRADLPPELIL